MAERPPASELVSLFQSLIVAEGITSAAGAGAGDSLKDVALAGAGISYVGMFAIVYPGQSVKVESFYITAFNNVTGEVTLDHAYKGIAAPIPAGVDYKIITLKKGATTADIEDALDAVYFDSIGGAAGTAWPVGTPGSPSNNWVDTKAIAAARKLSTIRLVHGKITIDANGSGYHFIGNGFSDSGFAYAENAIDINGHTLSNCSFEAININDAPFTGTLDTCGYFLNCANINVKIAHDCAYFIGCSYVNTMPMNNNRGFFNCGMVSATTMTDCSWIIGCVDISATTMTRCYYISGGRHISVGGAMTDCGSFHDCDHIFVGGAITYTGVLAIAVFSRCGHVEADTISNLTTLVRFVKCGYIDISTGITCGTSRMYIECNELYATINITNCVGVNCLGGHVTLTNCAALSNSDIVGNGLDLTIAASCVAGIINIYGNARVVNNTGGATINDYTIQKSAADSALQAADGVYFDSVNGVAGTAYPIGTPGMPVDNEADLLAILAARNLDKVVLRNPGTTLQFTGALADVLFIGEGEEGALSPLVDFNGQVINCTFINLRITDTTGSNLVSVSEFWDCDIATIIAHTVGGSNYHGCRFGAGGVTNPPFGIINCYNCEFLGRLDNTTGNIYIYGDCQMRGLTNTEGNIYIYGNLDVRDTGISQTDIGSIRIYGDCHVYSGPISNTTGSIYIYGDCQTGTGLAVTDTGDITIIGNCQVGSILSNTASGYITIKGDCQIASGITQLLGGAITIHGDLHVMGGSIVNNASGDITVHGNVEAESIGNATGDIYIDGNCHTSSNISQTGAGTFYVNGDCHIGTNLNIAAGGELAIYGNCQIGSLLNNNGIIVIKGNCQIGDGPMTNGAESITVEGNLDAGCTVTQNLPAGSLIIHGDCHVGIDLVNNGTIAISGSCKIGGKLQNKVSLTGGAISFTQPNPDLDLITSATSVTQRVVSRGSLTVKQMVAGATAIIDLSGGTLTIAATCTGGTIDLYGDCEITDLAGGVVTINDHRTNQKNTRFFQEAVAATDVDGTTWKDLLDRSTITKPVRICGFMVTVAGGWAGNAKVRIVDGAGNKIFPFKDEYVEATDFTSGTQLTFNFPVEVSASKGYKFQFRSSNAADGVGKTLELNDLDVQELS